jgi:hypothetical protein
LLSTLLTHASPGWLRFGGAILFLSLVAGCGATSSTPAGAASGSARPAVSTSPTSAASVAASPAASPAATLLAQALKPLRAASSFETTVKIAGVVAVSAKGRTVGTASQSTVTTGGRSVDYIEIPPKAWARDGSAAWVVVAAAQAPTAPLDVLAAPLSLRAADGATTGGTFTATYPATALGLEGDPLTVTITIEGDAVTFSYAATTAGHQTESTTTIRPAAADPIKAPGS